LSLRPWPPLSADFAASHKLLAGLEAPEFACKEAVLGRNRVAVEGGGRWLGTLYRRRRPLIAVQRFGASGKARGCLQEVRISAEAMLRDVSIQAPFARPPSLVLNSVSRQPSIRERNPSLGNSIVRIGIRKPWRWHVPHVVEVSLAGSISLFWGLW